MSALYGTVSRGKRTLGVIAPTELIAGKLAGRIGEGISPRSERIQNLTTAFQAGQIARARYFSSGMSLSDTKGVARQTEEAVAQRLGSQTLKDLLFLRKTEKENPLFATAHKLRQGEYISKVTGVADEFGFVSPESYFVGPRDIGPELKDQDWFDFLSAEQAAKNKKPPIKRVARPMLSIFAQHPGKTVGALAAGSFFLQQLMDPTDHYNEIPSSIGLVSEQQALLDNLPTENRGLNSFDGMPHGGLAGQLRKENTAFGSKYDRVRALSSMMGSTFESLTKSSSFQKALSSAVPVRSLGKGAFGEATLMKTTFQGEDFQFVRKQIQEGARESLFEKAANPEKYLRSLDLSHEARMMSPLGQTETVPSVYRSTEKELLMEHMPGEELYKYFGRGGELPSSAKESLYKSIGEAAERGIENLDIHQGNVLFDPATGRTSWIDWGQAQQVENVFPMALSAEMRSKATSAMTSSPSATAATKATRKAKGKLRQQNQKATKVLKKKKLKQLKPQGTPVELRKTDLAGEYKKYPGNLLEPVDPFAVTRIDGMQHGGLGARKRSMTTDFGSPWKGLFGGISRKISKYMGKDPIAGASPLLDPRKAAKQAQGQSLEEFASSLGGDVRIFGKTKYTGTPEEVMKKKIFEEIATKQGAGAGFVPEQSIVYLDPVSARTRAIQKAEQLGIDKELTKEVVQSENFLKTLLYHEHLEKQTFNRFGSTEKMVGPGARHQAGQVILGEGGFVRNLGDAKLASFFWQMRKTETEIDTFFAGFSAFTEKGVAPELRKLITDFGSPWRGLLDSTSVDVARKFSGSAREKLVESSGHLRIAQEHLWDWAHNGGKRHSGYQ